MDIPASDTPIEADSQDSHSDEWHTAEALQLTHFTAQASGHSTLFTIENNSKLVKPLNPHEAKIYEKIQEVPILHPHTAKYHGRYTDQASQTNVREHQIAGEYIVLQNLTAGFRHPCIMDVKLGQKNYTEARHDPEVIQKRRILMNATTAAEFGFRISGIRVFRPMLGNYLVRNSIHATRMLSNLDGTLMSAIKAYVNDGARVRLSLVEEFAKKIEALGVALAAQSSFDFMASSVLLIYEGDISVDGDTDEECVDVKLIDFDHTILTDSKADDSGVVVGVQSLAGLFRELANSIRMSQSTVLPHRSLPSPHTDDVEKKRPRSHSDPNFVHHHS